VSPAFQVGDVLRYNSERENRWCREGQAIVRDVTPAGDPIALDTYWLGGGDQHRLTDSELSTATVKFNLNDVRLVGPYDTWADFNPGDRFRVSHQHGLQSTDYVRVGAEPDMATRIDNARTKVRDASDEVDSAKRRLEWARQELSRLQAEAVSA
jgi:hypothetical protein